MLSQRASFVLRSTLGTGLGLILLCAVPLRAARADAPRPDWASVQQRMDAMLARQDALEAENAKLKEQVGSLEGRLTPATMPPVAAAVPGGLSGFNKGGGGFFTKGDDYNFRLLGYVQAVGSAFDSRFKRADKNGDFSVRRARLDFLADYYEDYQIFIEFDGGVTNAQAGQSDFGLVEARVNWKIDKDAVQLRAGKMLTPLSTENFRTSRDIDTVERYMALNTLIGLPAVDVQFGTMLHGVLGGDRQWGYFVGLFNGAGRANDNLSDNNGGKELQSKVTYSIPGFSAGLGVDVSNEREQTVTLTDLAFNNFVSAPVQGRRVGLTSDFFWERGPWSLRGEGLAFRFNGDETPAVGLQPQDGKVRLIGGFVQPAVYLTGDRSKGVQLLLRGELARLDADTVDNGDKLYALTVGANWYVNPNIRLQVDGILQYFDGPSALQPFANDEVVPLLLTELQFKF